MNFIFAGVSLCKSCIICYKRPYLASLCKSQGRHERLGALAAPDGHQWRIPACPAPPKHLPHARSLLRVQWDQTFSHPVGSRVPFSFLFHFFSCSVLLTNWIQLLQRFLGMICKLQWEVLCSWLFRFSSSALAEDTFFFSCSDWCSTFSGSWFVLGLRFRLWFMELLLLRREHESCERHTPIPLLDTHGIGPFRMQWVLAFLVFLNVFFFVILSLLSLCRSTNSSVATFFGIWE